MLNRSQFRSLLVAASTVLVVVYAFVSAAAKPSHELTIFADIAQPALIALVLVAFASNLRGSHGRARKFWMLMTSGAALWFISSGTWVYFELVLHADVNAPTVLDIVLFLHLVPMMAALATIPHEHRRMPSLVGMPLAMIAVWWMYLYSFVVIPWQYLVPDRLHYGASFNVLYVIESIVLIIGWLMLWYSSSGGWRSLYGALLLASVGYTISSFFINIAMDKNDYYTGSPHDIPLVLAVTTMVWAASLEPGSSSQRESLVTEDEDAMHATWISRLAICAMLSVPVMAIWSMNFGHAPVTIREFRVLVSFIAVVALAILLFANQQILSKKLRNSLATVRESFFELARTREALEYRATHDSMTGAMNRSAILAALERELSRASRSAHELAVLLIDLDHFKAINDNFGHASGDVAIVSACTRMQDCLRAHDYVGRYGGEEFLVIVTDCDRTSALQIAERIRTKIAEHPITMNAKPLFVTATIGMTLSRPEDVPESLLRRADLALYQGKATGRNRVSISDLAPGEISNLQPVSNRVE
ncbi:MAG TPA: diguanylate cyclase [Terriglobales bacterium]|nr:diguanylate cyclase [Terriglobales bacterium]